MGQCPRSVRDRKWLTTQRPLPSAHLQVTTETLLALPARGLRGKGREKGSHTLPAGVPALAAADTDSQKPLSPESGSMEGRPRPRGGSSETGKLCGLLTRLKGPEDSHPDTGMDGQTDGQAGPAPRGWWPATGEEGEGHRALASCTPAPHTRAHTHAKQRQRYIIKRIKTKGPDVQKKVSEEGGREEGRRRAPASVYKLQPPGKRGCWGGAGRAVPSW